MESVDGKNLSSAEGSGASPEATPIGAQLNSININGEYRGPSRALRLLEDFAVEVTVNLAALMPVLLSFLKHDDQVVVKKTIAKGAILFNAIVEELARQLHSSGKVETWLENTWEWMLKFKDEIYSIIMKPGSVGIKILAVKFLEVYILVFTSDTDNIESPCKEENGRLCNLSSLDEGHPLFNPHLIASEANLALKFLLSTLLSSGDFPGSYTIVLINCLSAVARKRPRYFNCVLHTLLAFNSYLADPLGAACIQHSLRISILGFAKCTHPLITESREKLPRILRAMNPGEATEQIIRRLEKLTTNSEHTSRGAQFSKDEASSSRIPRCEDDVQNKPLEHVADPMAGRATTQLGADDVPDSEDGIEIGYDEEDIYWAYSGSPELKRAITVVGALLAEGDSGVEALELFVVNMSPSLLADCVIAGVKQL